MIKRTPIKKRRPRAGINKAGRIRLSAAGMKKLRAAVWERATDNSDFLGPQCENWPNPHIFRHRCAGLPTELHHIVYRSHGGSDSLENCAAICTPCHIGIHAGKFAFRREDAL